MTQLQTVVEQISTFAAQHAPPSFVSRGIPLAVVLLLAGIGMSVFGAKLARWALTAAFVIGGGVLGNEFAKVVGFHPLLCAAVGALLIGTIGYLTLRLWIGVVAAGLVAALALGAFSYQRVFPHLGEFEQRAVASGHETPGTFSLPTPQEQADYLQRSPGEWASDFWAFVTAKDQRLRPNAQAVAIVALLVGLLVGLLATRTALVFSTSLLGTVLVAASLGGLMAHFVPRFYEGLLQRPQLSGAALGGFFVTSLLLQSLLTRKAKSAKLKAAE